MLNGRGRMMAAVAMGAVSLALAAPARVHADAPKTWDQAVAGLERREGLLPTYLDAKGGRVLVALTQGAGGDCGAFIYLVSMRSGLGSTPVGLDRSNPGPSRIIAFRRVGTRVYAELQNTDFRADHAGEDERQAVRESFPPSIVWSGAVEAEAGGKVLVDLTPFLTRDAFGVVDALRGAHQGDFALAADKTYADVSGAGVFPENLEFDAHETFTAATPGSEVRGIVPEPHDVTLIEHQALIKLPPPGFTPRLADPRTGAINALVADYGAPIGGAAAYRLAARFRLEKTDPAAARSPVKKPIVFYVDRAAPEPVKTALRDGARWWAEAFDKAGFIDAFRVEILPEGVSPLDARYNVINWVHRQTRGWSYGDPIMDPRTGEIIKGSVLLGSLRMRQDRMIFEGLVGADQTDRGGPNDPTRVALARLRQLAVHESGHALGLEHNFAGSTYGDRASVMDYPGPRVGIVDGKLDLGDAYRVGLGDWDRFAIKWLYSQVLDGAAGQQALEAMVRDANARGLRYVRDEDARPIGSAQPIGALWDDGPDAVAGLDHVLAVRRIALANFGPGNLPVGAPLSDLRRVIVPIYLFHRYEVESVAKAIGGVDFTYATRGDGEPTPKPVAGAAQTRALDALLKTLDPAVLDLSDTLLNQLSTGRDGADDHAYEIELFSGMKTPIFSLPDAARAASDVTLNALLEPSRLARVADQKARDPSALGLDVLLARTVDAVFADRPLSARQGALRRVTRGRLIARLAALREDAKAGPTVTALAGAALDSLGKRLALTKSGDPADLAQAQRFAAMILGPDRGALAALAKAEATSPVEPPPGMPIGGAEDGWFAEALGEAAPTSR